jgi:hypothetical protein
MLLDASNARSSRRNGRVDLVLLARTLVDPPRVAACRRWGQMLRRTYPNAELIPYVWHLVSHGPEDGLRNRGSRTLPGAPADFGRLAPTKETAAALEITRLCAEALETTTIAVRTPPGLTPGPVGRKRIGEFATPQAEAGFRVVWEPEGLWTPTEAMALLAPHPNVDVLLAGFEGGRPRREDDEVVLATRGAWLRVDGTGTRQAIHGGHVDALVEHVDACGGGTLVFTGPRAAANLKLTVEALDADGLL